MSVRRESALAEEVRELRQQNTFYRGHVAELMRRLTAASEENAALEKATVIAAPPAPPAAPPAAAELELVGMSVGLGMFKELWHVSDATDAAALHKAYDLYTALSRTQAPAERSCETSLGLMVARSTPRAHGPPSVQMCLFRSGRADAVNPIAAMPEWHALRRSDVMPAPVLDLG